MKYMVCVYTHQVKKYCDQQFYRALGKAIKGVDCMVSIVDNSSESEYFNRLQKHMEDWLGTDNYKLYRQKVEQEPKKTLFLRNVCDSVNFLRKKFLVSEAEYMVIFESDVIIPDNTFELFTGVEKCGDIIGGIYHLDFHTMILFDPAVTCLVPARQVLSGCTLYSRRLIEEFPFRWDKDVLGEFPDHWISEDALSKGYQIYQYAALKCGHMEMKSGGRGMNNL